MFTPSGIWNLDGIWLSCLGLLVFLFRNIFKLFWLWLYPMKVGTEFVLGTTLYSIITWCFSYWPSYRSEACCIWPEAQPKPNTADRGPITRPIWKTSRNDTFINKPVQYLSGHFLANVETSSEFRSSCYWTDWNRANTENIRIRLVFAVLAQ